MTLILGGMTLILGGMTLILGGMTLFSRLLSHVSPSTDGMTLILGDTNQLLWIQGRGSRGGGKGGNCPPNFLSQWNGYACAPP